MPTIAPVSHSTTGCQRSSSSSRASARRSALSRACLRPAAAREPGACTSQASPPRARARSIATLALCSSVSASGPSSGKSAIPMLAVTASSWPPMPKGLRRARRSFSATTITSASRLIPDSRSENTSSCPSRASVSAWRSVPSRASATLRRRSSRWLGPSVSSIPARPIDPELRDREPLLAALRVRDRDGEPVVEAARPSETRERVVLGEIGDLVLQALSAASAPGRGPPRVAAARGAAPGPPPPAAARGPARRAGESVEAAADANRRAAPARRAAVDAGRPASARPRSPGFRRPSGSPRRSSRAAPRGDPSRRAASRPSSPTNECQRLFHSAMLDRPPPRGGRISSGAG